MYLHAVRRAGSTLHRAGSKIRCFDSHFHVINDEFPLFMNQGYMPPIFKAQEYLQKMQRESKLEVIGGAIVSGSFQMYDQGYLLDALSTLNNTKNDMPPEASYVGVAQLDKIDDKQCREMNAAGVRAVRFNITRGVCADTETIRHFAQLLYLKLGWHAEFYVDPKLLHDERKYMELLISLPVISIDHCGLTAGGQQALLELMFRRRQAGKKTFVKLTGFGRYQGTPEELRTILSQLLRTYSRELMFATDLPGTRAPRAFEAADVDFLLEVISEVYPDNEEKQRQVVDDVFYGNAFRLYSPASRQVDLATAESAAGATSAVDFVALKDRNAQSTGERMQKILARLKFGSRRTCEEIISAGRVTVNGEKCLPGTRVLPTDVVLVDGKEIKQEFEPLRYILLHKPAGVVTTSADTHDRRTVMQLLTGVSERVFPVGRLDENTAGLLLLTNDGRLAHRLSHPRLSVEKTYIVKVDSNNWTPPDLARIAKELVTGVNLTDQEEHNTETESRHAAKADSAVPLDKTRLTVVLTEGRKRVIRRMISALGHTVTNLQRTNVATLSLQGLAPGMFRDLTSTELCELKSYVAMKEKAYLLDPCSMKNQMR